jgi:hypothetical protein
MSDDRPGWGAQSTRQVTWHDPAPALELVRTMSGREYLTGILEGDIPAPPIAEVLDTNIVRVTKGGRRVIFTSAEGVDAAGKLVATATSSLLVMEPSAPR